MSTAVMPQNAMYEFGDIIIKVGVVVVVFAVCCCFWCCCFVYSAATTCCLRD